jgi:hypothetical protein
VSNLFRSPVPITFVDSDNNEIATSWDESFLPRVGENVRIAGKPFLVVRVGYDLPEDRIERVWIIVDPA